MNVAELIERARDVAGERREVANAPLAWEDSVVLRHLNAAYRDVWNRLRAADEQWGLDHATAAALGGVVTPVDSRLGELVLSAELGDVLRVEDAIDGEAVEAPSVPLARLREIGRDDWPQAAGGRAWTFGAANNILYFTKPDGIDLSAVRVWFARHAPPLVRITAASYPTTSSLRLSSTADPTLGPKLPTDADAFRGVFFQCTSAPSGGAPERRKFQCSAWTAGTHPNFDLTFRAAHGLTTGTSVWETLPLLPEPHHEALAQLAAVRMYQAIGDVATSRAIAAQAGADLDQLVKLVESRQVQTPRFVKMEE